MITRELWGELQIKDSKTKNMIIKLMDDTDKDEYERIWIEINLCLNPRFHPWITNGDKVKEIER